MGNYYVDEIDGVFFTDRTDAGEQEFRSRIAAFEAAPYPAEVLLAHLEIDEAAAAHDGGGCEVCAIWDASTEALAADEGCHWEACPHGVNCIHAARVDDGRRTS